MKYQIIALKALHWFQSWMEDENMPYQPSAMEMHDIIEGTIVNSQLPSKYA
jgi:hypothetical protein